MESDNGSNIGTVLLRGSDTPEYLPISYTCGQFQKKGVHPYGRQRREGAYPWIHCAKCVSAWNKDPVFGVIGIQSGPRG